MDEGEDRKLVVKTRSGRTREYKMLGPEDYDSEGRLRMLTEPYEPWLTKQWNAIELHQKVAIVAACLIIAVSLLPMIGLMWRGLEITHPKLIAIWTRPILVATSIAAILVTAALWLRKK